MVCKILVGNKCDLEDKRVVEREEGQALADTLKIPFYETSAQEGVNI